MLRLKNITKDYAVADTKVQALKGINLSFRKNEFVSILGPSGCGKTTTLNIIGGLDKYTDGDLFINGKSTKEFTDRDWDVYRNHRIGFIFQSYNLIPHQTILGNVELALTISGVSKAERQERAKKALDKVGLEGQYHKKPNQLSGGQCQRVAIARALVNEPEILLADEPTGALDTVTSVQIMDLIKEIASERLVIMVTHNPELAERYSTRIVNLLDGEVLNDSNPFSEEDEIAEVAAINAQEDEQLTKEANELALLEVKSNGENFEEVPVEVLDKYKTKLSKKEKAKMSLWTAFKLSAKNLHSKLKRTIMVVIAGSIGIIGVSAVLAVSQGVRDYIESIQDDLLSGNPIQITKSGVDYETLMNSSSFLDGSEAIKRATEDGKINVNSLVEFLVKNQKALNSLTFQNKFDKNYVDYVLNMPKEYYNTISLRYGMAVEYNVYADFNTSYNTSDEFYDIKKDYDGARSLDAINSTYAESLIHILDSIGYSDKATTYANLITSLSKPIAQSINFEDNPYIKEQYDLVAGKYPSESKTTTKEILIVLDNNSMITDLTLAQLGFYSQESFYNVIYNALNETREDGKKINVNTDDIKQRFSYDELLGKTFRWYPNNSIFNKLSDTKFTYNHLEKDVTNKTNRLDLKVTGIVKLKEGTTYGALRPGFLFSEQTARDMIRKNKDSQIVKYISDGIAKERTNPKKSSIDYISSLLNYDLKYYWEIFDDNGVLTPFGGKDQLTPSDEGYDPNYNQSTLTIGEGDQMSSLAGLFSTGGAGGSFDPTNLPIGQEDIALLAPHLSNPTPQGIQEFLETLGGLLEKAFGSLLSDKKLYIKTFGGTFMPNSIQIFPTNFKMKDSVTSYLNEWNKIEGEDAKELTFDQFNEEFTEKTGLKTTLTADQREEIKYTDSVGLIIGIINTVINIITYALVAFTALSLIVSTVMIAIITYVSVMERVKEIGVIRSLGGRKKDVSHLFNAEAFIIGAVAGIFGVVVTYILQIIGNIVINVVSDGVVTSIANLTPLTALIMIAISILLTAISGLLPAKSAAKKDPVVALRTE